MRLYHTTAHADAILRKGFQDGTGSYMFEGIELAGVFLAPHPVYSNEGASGDQVLEVVLSEDVDMSQWAIEEEIEDGVPEVREWCVPAALINEQATVRRLDKEAQELPTSVNAGQTGVVTGMGRLTVITGHKPA